MIGRLSGVVVEARPDHVLLDVNGVGYDLSIPLGTFAALPASGGRATLLVKTHVREDAIQLFGFATAGERVVFERLLSVSGIGPKVALTILSGLPLPELVSAIASQDARRLATIPGVGKKLAERLGLELKEKMASLGLSVDAGAAPRGSALTSTTAEDAVGALLNLGYRRPEAEAAVVAATKKVPDADLNTLLQTALRSMAR